MTITGQGRTDVGLAEVGEPPASELRRTGPEPPAAVEPDLRLEALKRFGISITVLNVVGHAVLGFEQAPIVPVACVAFALVLGLVAETLDGWASERRPAFLGDGHERLRWYLPLHISALACSMLLFAGSRLAPYLFAVAVAVCSKYVIRLKFGGRPRHLLNPSNFGITVTLLTFHWVGIAPPYQFTSNVTGVVDWVLPGIILAFGTMLNGKLTHRLPLIAGWLVGFVLQALVRSVALDHVFAAALVPMTGLAFILFTNYMITDPASTPVRPWSQVAFGLATAAVYGLLVVSHVAFGLFFALTIVCLVRGVACSDRVLALVPWKERPVLVR